MILNGFIESTNACVCVLSAFGIKYDSLGKMNTKWSMWISSIGSNSRIDKLCFLSNRSMHPVFIRSNDQECTYWLFSWVWDFYVECTSFSSAGFFSELCTLWPGTHLFIFCPCLKQTPFLGCYSIKASEPCFSRSHSSNTPAISDRYNFVVAGSPYTYCYP